MSAESARRYWIDHFSSRDADRIDGFVSLTAADCLPLLEDLGLPRVDGVDYESAENRVFGFGEVVLKFFRPGRWSLAALQDEVDFLHDLLDDGLAVVRPIGTPGTWRGIHYLQYETVHPPFDLDPKVLTPPGGSRRTDRCLSRRGPTAGCWRSSGAAGCCPRRSPVATLR